MKYKMFIWVLVVLSFVLTLTGGILDYMNKDSLWKISKQHYWNDGIYLLLFSCFDMLNSKGFFGAYNSKRQYSQCLEQS